MHESVCVWRETAVLQVWGAFCLKSRKHCYFLQDYSTLIWRLLCKVKKTGPLIYFQTCHTHKSSLNVSTTIFSQRGPWNHMAPLIKTDFLRLIICVQKVRRLILQSGGDARIIRPASFYSVKLPRHPAGKCLISNTTRAIQKLRTQLEGEWVLTILK